MQIALLGSKMGSCGDGRTGGGLVCACPTTPRFILRKTWVHLQALRDCGALFLLPSPACVAFSAHLLLEQGKRKSLADF